MNRKKSVDIDDVVNYLECCRAGVFPHVKDKPVLDLRSVFGCHRRIWKETERRMVALGYVWTEIEDMKQYALSAPTLSVMIERLRSRFYVQDRY